jgi:transcriptional regulator NrdR family protein
MSACPACNALKTQVIASDTLACGWTRRRRRCTWGCDERWWTYELAAGELDLSERDPGDLRKVSRNQQEALDG